MIRSILKSLRREYMDVTLRTGRTRNVRIMERPGRWMDDAQLAALCDDLRTVSAKTLDAGHLNYGVFSNDHARLSDTIVTLVRLRDATPVAFNALVVMTVDIQPEPVDLLHLGLVMVDPDQRSGASHHGAASPCLWRRRRG